MSFMIETSARHIHLTQETLEKLFGEDDAEEEAPLSSPSASPCPIPASSPATSV